MVFIALIFMACQNQKSIERNVSFKDHWEMVEAETAKITVLRKEFDIDKQLDKLYFIELTSTENIVLQLNNSKVAGQKMENNSTVYNLTDYLQNQNIIEIQSGKNKDKPGEVLAGLEVKMHCVNKLYIPEISLAYDPNYFENLMQVEVKVKNAFDTEKQGVLYYSVYSDNNKKLFTKETPVFISGNSENTYTNQMDFQNAGTDIEKILVECKLYSNNVLFDSDNEVFELNDEALLSAK